MTSRLCNHWKCYGTVRAGFITQSFSSSLTRKNFPSPPAARGWHLAKDPPSSTLPSLLCCSRPQELLHHPQHGLPEELAAHQDGPGRGQRARQRGLQPELPGGHRTPAPPHCPPAQPGRHQGEAHRVRLQARHRRKVRLCRPEVRADGFIF